MNKYLFSNDLKGEKIAKRLSLCATILQAVAVLLAIVIFLVGLISGIILLASNNQSSNSTKTNQNSSYQSNGNRGTNNWDYYYYDSNDVPSKSSSSTNTTVTAGSISSGFGVTVILASIFASIYILGLFSLIALLLKALAAIVLHTYITALNTDKIADNSLYQEK